MTSKRNRADVDYTEHSLSDLDDEDDLVGAPRLGFTQSQGSVEDCYQKMEQVEHILRRPDSYVGSCTQTTAEVLVYDSAKKTLVMKEITYTPALFKIFDEILVNATDHKQRCKWMKEIRVELDRENGKITVWNDGFGIPVREHSEWGSYVVEGIFGSLMCSSNFDDTAKRVTGGRNGYGAKLTNIYSTFFQVETSSFEDKKRYKQVWRANMSKVEDPQVKDLNAKALKRGNKGDYTKITFRPDMKRFQMKEFDDDILALMMKRCYDAAAVSGVRIKLNGETIKVKKFDDYIRIALGGDDRKILCKRFNERWEIAVGMSKSSTFEHVSFVNGIATTKGGSHVNYITKQILRHLMDVLKKKRDKTGVRVPRNSVRNHLLVCVNCLIENPQFDSQTKEELTTEERFFGSTCVLPANFLKRVSHASTGIVDMVTQLATFKANRFAAPSATSKVRSMRGIKKLDDANNAGTGKSGLCTLVLTEGDSAKTLAVCGLGVVGRDNFGVYPLKGKPLNVREASLSKIKANEEIQNIIKIMGLRREVKYDIPGNRKSLRYGSVMIMADQDHDGSHIKGLIMNFLHWYNPSLLKVDDFVKQFITPIVKAKKGRTTKSFYTLSDFHAWKDRQASLRGWSFKYYKGLGTSTSKEAKEYFGDLDRHMIPFKYTPPESGRTTPVVVSDSAPMVLIDAVDGASDVKTEVVATEKNEAFATPTTDKEWIELVFSKSKADKRKRWLKTYDAERGIDYDETTISIGDFVQDELIHYSASSIRRAIPSVVDGLKPSQRKALFACFKRKLTRDIKVAQLVGYVSEQSAYHHGEKSMEQTIVKLAQNFVGSNNVNLLFPSGQFGSRLMGGKDAASSRYIFTRLAEVTRRLFPAADDDVLDYLEDEGQSIEPKFYVPIIPLVLVNGCDGIGTGWSTKIPNHSPLDVIANVRRAIRGEELKSMSPFYRGFGGTIVRVGTTSKYLSRGKVAIVDEGRQIVIRELPVGTWTQDMKERLEDMIATAAIAQKKTKSKKTKGKASADDSDEKKKKKKRTSKLVFRTFREYHTETTVHFEIDLTEETAKFLSAQPDGGLSFVVAELRLESALSTGNMHLWDHDDKTIQKFNDTRDIVRSFYGVRLQCYKRRIAHIISVLEKEHRKIDSQARFIRAVLKSKLELRRKKADILKRLDAFEPPLYRSSEADDDEEVVNDDDDDDDDDDGVGGGASKTSSTTEDPKRYDYLLKMHLYSLTTEKVAELESRLREKHRELEEMRKTDPHRLWLRELEDLEEALKSDEAKRLEEEEEAVRKAESRMSKKKKRKRTTKSKKQKKVKTKVDNPAVELGAMDAYKPPARKRAKETSAPSQRKKPRAVTVIDSSSSSDDDDVTLLDIKMGIAK